MPTLYVSKQSCAPSLIRAVGIAKADVKIVKVDLKTHRTEYDEDFYEIYPRGSVPVMKMDDGSLLSDSVALLLYIADSYPASKLAPAPGTPERYRLYSQLSVLANEIHPSFVVYMYSSEVARPELLERVKNILAKIEKSDFILPGKFLDGSDDHITIADLHLSMMLGWAGMANITLPETYTAYHARVLAHPTYAIGDAFFNTL